MTGLSAEQLLINALVSTLGITPAAAKQLEYAIKTLIDVRIRSGLAFVPIKLDSGSASETDAGTPINQD